MSQSSRQASWCGMVSGALLLAALPAGGSSRVLPPQYVSSADGRYALSIVGVPRPEPNQADWPVAVVYAVDGVGTRRELSRFPLAEWADRDSLQRLIADSGHVVTIDRKSWPSLSFAIYSPTGSLVRGGDLEELLTSADREALEKAEPENGWRTQAELDDARFSLNLEFVHWGVDPEPLRAGTLELSLVDGGVLHAEADLVAPFAEAARQRRRLPPPPPPLPYARLVDDSPIAGEWRSGESHIACDDTPTWEIEPVLERRFAGAPWVRFDSLATEVGVDLPLPAYTEVARRARITGRQDTELLVLASGEVICARGINRVPMGLDKSAVDAVRQWRLAPLRGRSGSVRTTVTFEFSLADHPSP
jgi:TonB family protein